MYIYTYIYIYICNHTIRDICEHNIYAIMKTMCPPSYHHNGFVATHALGLMMYNRHIYIYIYIYIILWNPSDPTYCPSCLLSRAPSFFKKPLPRNNNSCEESP